jgi:hypothetical protein
MLASHCTSGDSRFFRKKFHGLLSDQSLIGWNYIIMERFFQHMASGAGSILLKANKLGNICYKTVWTYVYEIWKIRCNKNYGETSQSVRQQAILHLTPEVKLLCQETSSIKLQSFFPQQLISSEILELPTQPIEEWVCKTRYRVKLSKQYIKQQEKYRRHNPPCHPLFKPKGTPRQQPALSITRISNKQHKYTTLKKPRATFIDTFFKI